jgi:hypothetical protein
MIHGLGQSASSVTDQSGHIAARVDHGVPGSAPESIQTSVSVAPQLLQVWVLGFGIEMRMGLTAIEESHPMAEDQRCVDQMATEKNSAPKDECPHR